MGTQKIEIGDIFEVPTAIGNAYIQYMAEVDQTTLSHLRYNSFGFINNSIGKRSYASYYPR